MTAQPTPRSSAPGRDLAPGLEALFLEHRERVYRAAYRITGNPMDAEDVLQTVFVRLLRREESLQPGPGGGAYVTRAAVNAALDVVRSRQRAGWAPLDEATLPPGPGNDRPDREHEQRELARSLRQALSRLAPRAAEMFALRYFEGLGNRQIAELLGTSQGVVAVLLHRTRNRLRKQLQTSMGVSQ
ncbi:MAG: sigma-70 family RNA polymerase sigma factor [Thermoanaerobaculia bacterium]